MKPKQTLILSILAATVGLLSLSVSAQPPVRRTMVINGEVFTVPADATTGTARAIVGITIPAVDPNTCTSTNNNCYRPGGPDLPGSGGASGSQCGWVGVYQGNIGSRVNCEGRVLGLGTIKVCYPGHVLNQFSDTCEIPGIPEVCIGVGDAASCDGGSAAVPTQPARTYLGPVSKDLRVTSWNCPANYTFTSVINSGGSNGSDYFYTCVKN